ncbi:putative heme iron utilization protein [Nocardiopsis arvandica]|uniref:Putative heme iron utilization protein n=1 Tax=Nocardiopsis sinuspersici TaxID=501010 RepID=A0A7Y9XEF8_9ACTN|nr:putative heme iron utilization protein [Nocardiopsis sinuspersici]
MPPTHPFSPEVVAAVTAHMNGDHPEDTLLICRALGGLPEATAARMTGLDGDGGDYAVTAGGAEHTVRIPWARPLTERAQIRAEVVRMYQEAREKLGAAPCEGH